MNRERPMRRSPRLQGYDYTQEGAYFITICSHNREALFGRIVHSDMQMNPCGSIVQACWDDLPRHYTNIELDAFVVMPNHVHGILLILDSVHTTRHVGEGLRPSRTPKTHTLSEIIRAVKSFSARRINELRQTPGAQVWQRSFHDHIIRNERELNTLRLYVQTNPARWAEDTFYQEH